MPTANRGTRVLIIEDDPLVRSVICTALRRQHDVTAVDNGDEAQALLSRDREFDVVLCDWHLPGLNGLQLRRWIAEALPELLPRTGLVSGRLPPRTEEYFPEGVPAMLQKPFRVATLRSFVDGLLARGRSSPRGVPLG